MDLAQLVEFTRWMAIILTGISLSVFIKYIYDNIGNQVKPYPSGQGTTGGQQAITISGIGDQPKKIEELTDDELKRRNTAKLAPNEKQTSDHESGGLREF